MPKDVECITTGMDHSDRSPADDMQVDTELPAAHNQQADTQLPGQPAILQACITTQGDVAALKGINTAPSAEKGSWQDSQSADGICMVSRAYMLLVCRAALLGAPLATSPTPIQNWLL